MHLNSTEFANNVARKHEDLDLAKVFDLTDDTAQIENNWPEFACYLWILGTKVDFVEVVDFSEENPGGKCDISNE